MQGTALIFVRLPQLRKALVSTLFRFLSRSFDAELVEPHGGREEKRDVCHSHFRLVS